MSRQQWKLLLCSAAAIGLLVCSLFVFAWFEAESSDQLVRVDLTSAGVCGFDGTCASLTLAKMKGFYPLAGTVAFWTGVAVLVLVVIQSVSRLVAGTASTAVSKLGYLLAGSALLFGVAAGFLFAPDPQGIGDLAETVIERTWAPYAFIGGCLMSSVAMHLASIAWLDDEAEYKPVVLDRGRLPVTPLSVNKVPTPPQGAPRTRAPSQAGVDATRSKTPSQVPLNAARTKSGSQAPLDTARTKSGSQPPLDMARTKSGSQPPLDTARTKSGSQPPLDTARTKSGSQPPLDTARTKSGLQAPLDTARTKSGSQAPLDPARARTPSGQVPRLRTPSSQFPTIDAARTKSGSQAPLDVARTKSASQPPAVARTASASSDLSPRTRPPSSPGLPLETLAPSTIAERVKAVTAASNATSSDSAASSTGEPRTRPPTSPGLYSDVRTGERTKAPSQPGSIGERTSPGSSGERTKAPSSPGSIGERTKAPSQPPAIDPIERSHTSSSGPIDLAARLSAAAPTGVLEPLAAAGAAAIEVAMRGPLPSPEPVPPDQIPVAPESGLTIRKRTTSTAPPPAVADGEIPIVPEIGLTIRTKPASVSPPIAASPAPPTAAAAVAPTQTPADTPQAHSAIKYATISAELTSRGIRGIREDGVDKLIGWNDIVSVVARRLPPEPPFDGATFVDIVSSPGSTMRILPSTRIIGGLPLPEPPVARARAFLQAVAAQALEAKLDAATRLFADSDGQAVQLPTAAVLDTHDARFA